MKLNMRFDLHIHSIYSKDSKLLIDDIINYAVKIKLDGIAICDHDSVEGSIHAIKRVKQLGLPLIIIPGIEVTTNKGHVLVLGTIKPFPEECSIKETIKIAKKRKAIVIASHPFKGNGIGDVSGLGIDGIETFNSRCFFGENKSAKKMAKSLKIPETGGSDSHILSTIGYGYTEIDAEPNLDSILYAIKQGKTKSGGKLIPLHKLFHQVMNHVL